MLTMRRIARLANFLDRSGLHKAADTLTYIMNRLAEEANPKYQKTKLEDIYKARYPERFPDLYPGAEYKPLYPVVEEPSDYHHLANRKEYHNFGAASKEEEILQAAREAWKLQASKEKKHKIIDIGDPKVLDFLISYYSEPKPGASQQEIANNQYYLDWLISNAKKFYTEEPQSNDPSKWSSDHRIPPENLPEGRFFGDYFIRQPNKPSSIFKYTKNPETPRVWGTIDFAALVYPYGELINCAKEIEQWVGKVQREKQQNPYDERDTEGNYSANYEVDYLPGTLGGKNTYRLVFDQAFDKAGVYDDIQDNAYGLRFTHGDDYQVLERLFRAKVIPTGIRMSRQMKIALNELKTTADLTNIPPIQLYHLLIASRRQFSPYAIENIERVKKPNSTAVAVNRYLSETARERIKADFLKGQADHFKQKKNIPENESLDDTPDEINKINEIDENNNWDME